MFFTFLYLAQASLRIQLLNLSNKESQMLITTEAFGFEMGITNNIPFELTPTAAGRSARNSSAATTMRFLWM